MSWYQQQAAQTRDNEKKMFFGRCNGCGDCDCHATHAYELYCDDCWDMYKLNNVRCFTIAAIYDDKGELISFGTSLHGCAERDAIWRLPEDKITDCRGMLLVACRVRRNKTGRIKSYGCSLPCSGCLMTMNIYGIRQVCYSLHTFEWKWDITDDIRPELTTTKLSTVVMFENSGEARLKIANNFICTLPTWPISYPRIKPIDSMDSHKHRDTQGADKSC